jgi:hypothetical protein
MAADPPALATLTPLQFLLASLSIVWVLSGFVFRRPDIARAAVDALLLTAWWSAADWGGGRLLRWAAER